MEKPTTIDEYIAQCPTELQQRLQLLRTTIRRAEPKASERISWGMATFTLEGNLVHFAAHKAHIGFYPGNEGVEQFLPDLQGYRYSKGAIQFPHDKALPAELIERIVQFRAAQNRQWALEKEALRKKKK